MQVREVGSDIEPFVEVPYGLYEAGAWVPPARSSAMARALGTPHHTMGRWLAERSGTPVGRVAASIDARDAATGNVGFYECEDDEATAHALLGAACDWLKAEGVTTIRGPVDLSIWYGYRFMTEGHALPPFLGEPRNQPYYPAQWQRFGFAPVHEWLSFDLEPEHVVQLCDWAATQEAPDGYRSRSFDLAHFDRQLEEIHPLLVAGFANNYGHAPLSLEEMKSLFAPMAPLLDGDMCKVVETLEGSAVGFTYLYPDWAPAFIAAAGNDENLGPSVAALGRPTAGVAHTICLDAEHRKRGVAERMLAEPSFAAMADVGFERMVGALVKERTLYHRVTSPSRKYSVYELARSHG